LAVGILQDALFIALLIWCSVSDLKRREISNTVVLLLLGLSAAHLAVSVRLGSPWYEYALGMLLAVPFFIAWTKELLGGGDVKLVFAMGLYLGVCLTLVSLAFTLLICAGLLIWRAARRRNVHVRIALAPAFTLGAAAATMLSYLF
jgi:leader peptidase (prepilin peptidase)/N-methyltransferase